MCARSLNHLRYVLIALTLLLISSQFYSLLFKLPFDVAVSHKSTGFFAIYLSQLLNHFSLWPPLLFFITTHLFIQLSLTILIYYIAKKLAHCFLAIQPHVFFVGLILWIITQLVIFMWNSYLFPYSYFAQALSPSIDPLIFTVTLWAFTTLLALVFAVFTVKFTNEHPLLVITILLILTATVATTRLYQRFILQNFSTFKKPNVILIITDSLRPDFIKRKNETDNAPIHMSNILNHSAFMENSLTLLGRSTPGLAAILTGNYPITNGARFNLIANHHLHFDHSLTHILKKHGYQTVFAADGRQFINLDSSFGFDQIISAKSGIYDFIFTYINDTPLSNLLTNTWIGSKLFPYNYANRNSYYSYLPQSFPKLVSDQLINQDPNKPVLLVAAMTIAHWPYVWAQQPNLPTLEDRYQNSVKELDKQFSELLDVLRRRGLLENSIIVTLSDHGDSLGMPGDRITIAKNYHGNKQRLALIPRSPYTTGKINNSYTGIDTSAGHGTDLLSMSQLQTTLGFYYAHHIKPTIIHDRVALIDVTPTLLDLLKIPYPTKFQGLSLVPLIEGKKVTEFERPIFLETEIDIPLIDITFANKNHSAMSRLIEQYASLYTINLETQQLVLKDSELPKLISQKQLGIMYHNWLLAYFPGKNSVQTTVLPVGSPELQQCYYTFPAQIKSDYALSLFCFKAEPSDPYYVLVNLATQQWEIFFPNETPKSLVFKELYNKLHDFYDNRIH